MAKSNSKSIRLTDDILAYIESAPGDGFSQKFENIILEAKEAEPERKKRLESYDRRIKQKEVQLEKISEKVQALDGLVQVATGLNKGVRQIKQQIQELLDDS